LVAAISDSDQPVKELMGSIKAKEIERVALAERIRLLGAESNVATLHPHTITAFGKSIETLHAKLKRNADDPECRMAFGNIIDSIIVHPTGKGLPYEISLYARISAIIGVDLFPARRSHEEIVAAEGLRVSVPPGPLHHPHHHQDLLLASSRVNRAFRHLRDFSGLAAMAISPFAGFILLLSSIAGVFVGIVFHRGGIHSDRVSHQRAPWRDPRPGADELVSSRFRSALSVMPGLVPGIHVLLRWLQRKDVDGRAQTSPRSLRRQTTMPGHNETHPSALR
jgi:hypothetical protein